MQPRHLSENADLYMPDSHLRGWFEFFGRKDYITQQRDEARYHGGNLGPVGL